MNTAWTGRSFGARPRHHTQKKEEMREWDCLDNHSVLPFPHLLALAQYRHEMFTRYVHYKLIATLLSLLH